VAVRAAPTLWRVEALLALLDGAAAAPPSPHAALNTAASIPASSPALACVSRLLKRLGLGGPDGGDLAGVISLLRMGVGTHGQCSPRHRMPYISRNKDSACA